jgi:O-methyltransferase involved in polyketide biosynthesis
MTQPRSATDILDQMHSAILRADFDTLGSLSPALEGLLSQLDQIKDKSVLTKIKNKCARNEACLLAAGRGLRSAQRRVAELRGASQGFSTYDGTGKRAQHGLPNSLALRF